MVVELEDVPFSYLTQVKVKVKVDVGNNYDCRVCDEVVYFSKALHFIAAAMSLFLGL